MAIRQFKIPGKIIPGTINTVDTGPTGQYGVDSNSGQAGVYRLASDLSLSDSKVGLFSCWFFYDTAAAAIQFVATFDVSNLENHVWAIALNNASKLSWVWTDNALSNTIIYESADAVSSGAWHHLLVSWDTAAGTNQVFLDDADVYTGATANTVNDMAIGYSRTDLQMNIMETDLIAAPWRECISQLYFNPDVMLDLTTTSNRRLFIDASQNPISLGADGSLPTGSIPVVYLDNPASAFHLNRGTGGDFSRYEPDVSLDDCASNPAGV